VHCWPAPAKFTATAATRTHTWRERTWQAFDKQCRTVTIISKTVILTNTGRQTVSDRRRHAVQHNADNGRPTTTASVLTHDGRNRRLLVLFVLCPLNILPVQADDGDGSGGKGELMWLVLGSPG